jgi:DNA-binding transcriptional LysR family regulator
MDLDLRKLRYFVAVAEHGTFLRAAEVLHIAQPVLSRQIRSLENDLKVTLFDRDTRGTRLTAAGEALLEEALSLLAAAEAAHRRVRAAASGSPRFTVGFTPGVSIAPAVREFSARHPDVSVEVLRMEFFHRADSVRDGQVDVGYLRLPVDTHGLATVPLFSEPHVVALPTGHSLAGQDDVSLAALRGERMLLDHTPEWSAGSASSPADPVGQPALGARSIEELLEQVAAGRGVVVIPLSTARYFARPDVAHVVVADMAPAQVALAWRRARRSALIAEYVEIARGTVAEPPPNR